MLAANPDFEIRLHAAPTFRTHRMSCPTRLDRDLKRIVSHDLAFDVVWKKAARIVAAQSKRRLRKSFVPNEKNCAC